MKKSNFTALVLGTVGVVFFALGMCMGLLPEWDMFRQGVVCGVIGLVILLITVIVWRKMEGKAPIQLNARTIGSVLVGVLARCFWAWACACPWCLERWLWASWSVWWGSWPC